MIQEAPTRQKNGRPLDDRHLIQYLLGELAEGEMQELEEAYLEDSHLFDRVCAAEWDLLDDYARGVLDESLKGRVEAVYLASPERRRKLGYARAFFEHLERGAVAPPEDGVPPDPEGGGEGGG